MSCATGNRRRPGLRLRITLWTISVLAAALGAGFVWVQQGLRSVLESRNDLFLERKGAELAAAAQQSHGGHTDLHDEIEREVEAYADAGLVVISRNPAGLELRPATGWAEHLAEACAELVEPGSPATVHIPGRTGAFRVLRVMVQPQSAAAHPLDLALSLDETEAVLTQFNRRAVAGSLVFLLIVVAGGWGLAQQALRPVAQSIETAQALNPADLSARLPRSGAGDELDRLAETINALLDRLASYHAQAARFTADASHELRGPLAAIRAAIDVAVQQPRSADEYRDFLGDLGEQCDRLTALVNGLLLLARGDAGQIELRRAPIRLCDLVRDVVEMYHPLAEERSVRLEHRGDAAAIVEGDGQLLRQLISNLVDNAIKFNRPGGRVAISVSAEPANVTVTVADTGVGVPPEHIEHIFERFYQADSARCSAGSGLGLSICHWIVAAHGGTLHVSSEPGAGSAFTVTLPVGS